MNISFNRTEFDCYVLPTIHLTMGAINFCWLFWYIQIFKWWDNSKRLSRRFDQIHRNRNI